MPASDKLDDTLDRLRIAVEKLLASNKPTKPPEMDTRRHFYKMFNQEADEYDRDFHKKYHDDLNTTLIFAGLFSAVASAFIIDIQQDIRPDYNEMSFTILTMLLNTTSGIPSQLAVPVASGPKASAVQVQSILFSSLASALLAAFLAMLGKQWLNLHVEGSLIDRSRHRELKMRGMITWRFKFIMECLPLVMQISLLLLGYALAQYMWDLSRTISAVVAAFAAFGVLFYLFIVFAATVWKTCPFQTPVSIVLRHVIRHVASLAKKYQPSKLREVRDQLSGVARFRKLNESFYSTTLIRSIHEGVELDIGIPSDTPAPATAKVNPEEDESTHTSDVNCISTMFRFASGSDAIVAVTGFIPEIDWASNVRRVPVLEVCDSLSQSFEFQKDGRVFVRPGMKEQAYGSAKALLHLRVQRLCADLNDNPHITTQKFKLLFGYRSKEDHELESTLWVLDAISDGEKEIPWKKFTLGDSHCCWMSYILRCRTWAVLRTRNTLTKDILGFVRYSFSREPPLPRQVIADCLLMIYMIIEWPQEFSGEMLIKDKSAEIEVIIRSIYHSLQLILTSSSSPTSRQAGVEVLELMMSLEHQEACVESFGLFRKVVANLDSDNWFRRPAELLLVGAFKWDGFRPFVGDPTDLLHFLRRCLLDQEGGLVRDELIEQIMFALGEAPGDEVGEGLAKLDFTEPLFFNGLCHALRNDAPHRLRRATVTFLRHLDTQLFGTNGTFTEGRATKLVSRWSTSVYESLKTSKQPLLVRASLTTLLGLLDSPFWRKCIPDERWDLLRYLNGIDDELMPPSAYRCFRNQSIIPHLLELQERGVNAFTPWIAFMWARYPDLSKGVATQLGHTTWGVAYSLSKSTVAFYASTMDGEIERVRGEINSHHSWSFEEAIVRLRARRGALQLARQELARIERIAG